MLLLNTSQTCAYISHYGCTAANVKIEFERAFLGALHMMHISHAGCSGITILQGPSHGSGVELDLDPTRFRHLFVM